MCLVDLNSKAGTELDDVKIPELIPMPLKPNQKIKFGMSSRHYIVELDLSKMKRAAEDQEKELAKELERY